MSIDSTTEPNGELVTVRELGIDFLSSPQPSTSDSFGLFTSIALQLGRFQSKNDFRTGLPFFILDGLAVLTAIAIAFLAESMVTQQLLCTNLLFWPAVLFLTWMVQHVHGLYPACGIVYTIEFRRVLRTCLIVSAAVAMALVIRDNPNGFPIIGFGAFSISLAFLLSSLRPVTRRFLCKFDWWAQPVAVVGSSSRAIELHETLCKSRYEGLRSIGVVFDPKVYWGSDRKNEPSVFIGPLSELGSILLKRKTCRILVADVGQLNDFQIFHGIPHVTLPTDLRRQPTEKAQLFERHGNVELHCYHGITSPSAMFAKRLMDLVVVLGLIGFWLPVFLLICMGIKWYDPGPLFYRQRRVGRFGKPFWAIKFRSMVCDADRKLNDYLRSHPELQAEWDLSHKLKCDPRVTWIGEFLRKSSLDELPQVLNVLWGDMSLVGPRPIIDCSDYDRKYIEDHPEVFELYQFVRPGITGLWQVSGRNITSYEQRIEFDRQYLHNWSVMLDVFILWRTVKTAVFCEGAY